MLGALLLAVAGVAKAPPALAAAAVVAMQLPAWLRLLAQAAEAALTGQLWPLVKLQAPARLLVLRQSQAWEALRPAHQYRSCLPGEIACLPICSRRTLTGTCKRFNASDIPIMRATGHIKRQMTTYKAGAGLLKGVPGSGQVCLIKSTSRRESGASPLLLQCSVVERAEMLLHPAAVMHPLHEP